MVERLQTGKPSRYITNTTVNSAFDPSGIGKSSTGLLRWQGVFTCVGWQITLCDPIWQVTFRSSAMGFPQPFNVCVYLRVWL